MIGPDQISVDDLSIYIKELFEDSQLKDVTVRGELIDFKRHSSGHCYFSLGGKESRISSVLFKSDTRGILKWPRPGDDVLVRGRVSVYPARGTYQLYAKKIYPVGAGAMSRAKEELRLKLEKEGLFDVKLKRPIPPFPKRLICITSPTGAAFQDVLKVTRSRYPVADIMLIPALVQGAEATESIVSAFSKVYSFYDSDSLVLLVRGGGSRDDLYIFDDEQVVRAIRSCPLPVIVGVGHEIDESLADLAGDLKAATPSEAAEVAVPDRYSLIKFLEKDLFRMSRACRFKLIQNNSKVESQRTNLLNSIEEKKSVSTVTLDRNVNALDNAFRLVIQREKNRLIQLSSKLEGLSPLSIINRGFISCSGKESKKAVTTVKDLSLGEEVCLHFKDGEALAKILTLSPKGVD